VRLADLEALPAPATGFATLALGEPSLSDLDQSELVGVRELAELASRLAKRKSEKLQAYGRALMKAIRGEPYAAPGGRNSLLLNIAHQITDAFPFCDPDGIVDCFRASLDRMTLEPDEGHGPAPTPEQFRRMLTEYQGGKQARRATLDTLARTAQASGLAQPHGTAPVGALPGVADQRSVIVLADGDYWLRHPRGVEYPIRVNTKDALRVELQRCFGDAGPESPLPLFDEFGQMWSTDQILRTYCSNAHTIVHDYAATSTVFDTANATIRIGYVMARMRDGRLIEPAPDQRVEDWLLEIAGGTESDLIELYDWIAATDQRYIRTTAAALALVGPADAGKTLFMRALAHTWGCPAPVKLKTAVDRFNGPLQRCPIWHADERMPDDLTDAAFR